MRDGSTRTNRSSTGSFKAQYETIEHGSAGMQTELIEAAKSFKTSTPTEIETIYADASKRVLSFKHALAKLTPPSNGRAQYTKYLASLTRLAADVRAISADVADRHPDNTTLAHIKAFSQDVGAAGSSRLAFERAAGIS